MIEMVVDSIRVSLVNYQRVVILREKDAARLLPIWIGQNEADAIAIRLQSIAVARPLTHDLLKSVIDELGATVEYVLVSALTDDVFYARVVLDVNGEKREIDSRPSDAIALAVRCETQIFADESVLEKAGIVAEGEKDEEEQDEHATEGLSRPKEDEIQKLAAFRDFINTLDLDNLGHGESGKS
ncbi:MAG: bifunctional nuclease family protein [Chloroflexota bacterium]